MANEAAELASALQSVARCDREALRRVYELSARRLFAICLRISADRATAEDVLQDVYLIVWRRAHRFDESRGSGMAWLSTIARHRALDRRREAASRLAYGHDPSVDVEDPSPIADAIAVSNERSRLLHDSFDALDIATRDALQRAFFQGLTYSELAASCAVPLGTMKRRIRRGLLQLRRVLDSVEAEPQRSANSTSPLDPAGCSPSREAWPCHPTPSTSLPT